MQRPLLVTLRADPVADGRGPPALSGRRPRAGELDSYSGLLNKAAPDRTGAARRQMGVGKPHDGPSVRAASGMGRRDMREGSINILKVGPLHGHQQAACRLWCASGRSSNAQMLPVSSREPWKGPGSSLLSLPAQSGSPVRLSAGSDACSRATAPTFEGPSNICAGVPYPSIVVTSRPTS